MLSLVGWLMELCVTAEEFKCHCPPALEPDRDNEFLKQSVIPALFTVFL